METDAEEVFLLMRRDFRVSRNVRAWWFFQHIDRCVQIEESEEEVDFDSLLSPGPERKLSYTPHDADIVSQHSKTFSSNRTAPHFVLEEFKR